MAIKVTKANIDKFTPPIFDFFLRTHKEPSTVLINEFCSKYSISNSFPKALTDLGLVTNPSQSVYHWIGLTPSTNNMIEDIIYRKKELSLIDNQTAAAKKAAKESAHPVEELPELTEGWIAATGVMPVGRQVRIDVQFFSGVIQLCHKASFFLWDKGDIVGYRVVPDSERPPLLSTFKTEQMEELEYWLEKRQSESQKSPQFALDMNHES